MANYDSELDEAQKQFWNRVWQDYKERRDSTQTKLKKVLTDHFGADYLQHIQEIQKNTADMPWLAKFAANAAKFLDGQAELRYPSKKK